MTFRCGTSLAHEVYSLLTATRPQRLWLVFLSFTSLAQLVCAELLVRIEEVEFELGQDVTIKWQGGQEPVSIQLFSNDGDGSFTALSNITSNGKGDDQFEWKTPSDLKPGTYSIMAIDKRRRFVPSLLFDVMEGSKTVEVQPFNSESADTPSAPSSQPTSASITTPAPTPLPSGLTTSAKAGIGIGVGVSGLTMLALATVFFRRDREMIVEEEEALEPVLHNACNSPRSLSPVSPHSPTPIISPLTPVTSKTPRLFHFPESLTLKMGKPFSRNTPRSPCTPRSPKPWVTPWEEMNTKRVLVVGPPLTELPAGDVDFEVLNRHEMATTANIPELPGSPGKSFSGRGRSVPSWG